MIFGKIKNPYPSIIFNGTYISEDVIGKVNNTYERGVEQLN